MPTDDFLLFIDSNKYLDLYRTVTGRFQLASIREQADHILVTAQVVSEVKRNKIKVAAEFLNAHFKKLTFTTYNVPDHFFGSNEAQRILSKMKQAANFHRTFEQ